MMVYEGKEGTFEKSDRRSLIYYGVLTVSGTGSIKLPCRGRPYEVSVGFSDPTPPPPGCGPTPVDSVDIEIDHVGKPLPMYAIKISWDVQSGSTREITWEATVLRSY